jgi:hypothetical protein
MDVCRITSPAVFDTVNQELILGAASGVIESDCEVIGL